VVEAAEDDARTLRPHEEARIEAALQSYREGGTPTRTAAANHRRDPRSLSVADTDEATADIVQTIANLNLAQSDSRSRARCRDFQVGKFVNPNGDSKFE